MPPPKASSTGTVKSTKRSSLNGTRQALVSNTNANVPKSILKKQSTTGRRTHNKRITFHNKKKTKRIPNLNSMPEDILQDIWWAAEDYDDIMRSFEYTVFMMEAGEGKAVDDGAEHCTRGLELRTEAGKWARFEHKRDCYNAVLDEQDRQWNAGEDNQEKIANCCREVTAKTQRIACRKGMQDEKEIVDFVADTRATLLKSGNSPFHSGRTKKQSGTGPNGSKLPSRSKSNSTGSLKRRTTRTDSGKARVEKSPPRKPERVLSGKSERGDVTPNHSMGAPRTPKRSISSKSSEKSETSLASGASSTKKGLITPTNSAKANLQRMPQRQTFSNTAAGNSPISSNSPSRASPKTSKSASAAVAKKKSPSLPKMPKRSASNNSTASSHGNSDTSGDESKPKGLTKSMLSRFGG